MLPADRVLLLAVPPHRRSRTDPRRGAAGGEGVGLEDKDLGGSREPCPGACGMEAFVPARPSGALLGAGTLGRARRDRRGPLHSRRDAGRLLPFRPAVVPEALRRPGELLLPV